MDPHHEGVCDRCGEPTEYALCEDCRADWEFEKEERDDGPACDLCNGTGFPGTTERNCPQCTEGGT